MQAWPGVTSWGAVDPPQNPPSHIPTHQGIRGILHRLRSFAAGAIGNARRFRIPVAAPETGQLSGHDNVCTAQAFGLNMGPRALQCSHILHACECECIQQIKPDHTCAGWRDVTGGLNRPTCILCQSLQTSTGSQVASLETATRHAPC